MRKVHLKGPCLYIFAGGAREWGEVQVMGKGPNEMTGKKTKDFSYMSLLNIISGYTSVFYIKIKWIFKGTFLPYDIITYINISSPLFTYKLLVEVVSHIFYLYETQYRALHTHIFKKHLVNDYYLLIFQLLYRDEALFTCY